MIGPDLDLGDYLATGVTAVGVVAALVAIGGPMRAWYRRTLGRRRDRYERLARLGTGAHLTFVETVLGEPPAINHRLSAPIRTFEELETDTSVVDDDGEWIEPEPIYREQEFRQCFFIDRDYYVQAILNEDRTVVAFSVTTRSRWFRPVFTGVPELSWTEQLRFRREVGEWYRPLFRIKLGRTRFSALAPDDVGYGHVDLAMGARMWSYAERHSFGNPGHYQAFVFANTNVAYRSAALGNVLAVHDEIGDEWPAQGDDNSPAFEELPELQRFRRESVITTYTVIGPLISETEYPFTYGPHGDEVRTLP